MTFLRACVQSACPQVAQTGGKQFSRASDIFLFSSHLASLFVNIRGACKLELLRCFPLARSVFKELPAVQKESEAAGFTELWSEQKDVK